jgi:hypothetical protein
MEPEATISIHREDDPPLSVRALLASARADVVTAEQRVRWAQEELRGALLASADAHRRAARLAIWAADVAAAKHHALWAKEDALSADCIPTRGA